VVFEETREPEGAAEKASSEAVELSEGEGACEAVAVIVDVDAGRWAVGIATDEVASGPAAGWPPESRLRTASRARHGGGAQSSSARPERSPSSLILFPVCRRRSRWLEEGSGRTNEKATCSCSDREKIDDSAQLLPSLMVDPSSASKAREGARRRA